MKVQDYLKQNGVEFKVFEHNPAYTAQEVAASEHVTGHAVAKAVLVRAKKDYALCVLPASYQVDPKKAGDALGVRKVKLADEDDLAEVFPDVEVGAEPPFGNLYDIPTVVDEHLSQQEEIVFQSGDHRHAIRMKYADYANLADPKVADISVHE